MDKRQDILTAARARFRHYGLEKTTMQEIATDTGVAVGTLYRYFKDKDELFVACTDEFVTLHQREIERILGAKLPANEKLRQYLMRRFEVAREASTATPFAAEIASAVFRVKPHRLQEEAQMMLAAIIHILEEGRHAGLWKIADPSRDARVLLYSIAHFFPNATMKLDRWPTAEELAFVLDWFLETWMRQADVRPPLHSG